MKLLDRPMALDGVATIAAAVRSGSITAMAVLEAKLARIERLNPRLNCFVELTIERARRDAAAVDAMVAAGRDPGPLAGVPFGVKDNYDVAGRITTAGSIINRDLPPSPADAVLLQRAARAGAVLVGVQNMDEYAYGFTTENAHYGATRNPRDTERSAGGSSGGSAAAVAAGLCDFSLGTDTNGSIRVPSSFCGIFGLKPTFGRLPRTGTFPFVHDLDHLGPFARSVDDLALVYDAMQGHDDGDAACARRPAERVTHLLDALPVGTNIAVLDGWFADNAGPEAREAVAHAAKILGAADRVTLPDAVRARAAAYLLTCASGGELHREALATRAGDFDPATRHRLLAGLLAPAAPVLYGQRFRRVFAEQAAELFRHHDLLLAPATPFPATLLEQETIMLNGRELPARPNIGVLTQPISFIGLPVVAVPVPLGDMPIAVQIIAPPWREALALQAGARLEAEGLACAPVADPC